MITSWHQTANHSDYETLRFNKISQAEGVEPFSYIDTKGIPSIGIGFNLHDLTVRTEVFKAMGINANDTRLAGNAAAQAAELGYINQLIAKVAQFYADTTASEISLQVALADILIARSVNPLLSGFAHITSRTNFKMEPNEIQNVFNDVIQNYETAVNSWLSSIPDSNERVALVSLAYNGIVGPGKSPALRQAILDDDRAEAWYQIRYESNGGASQSPGIADRRLAESNLFSLYDNPGQGVAEAEAKDVLRMYTTHRTDIQGYEAQFATQFVQGGTNTIQFQLIGAKTTLIALYAEGRTIDGEVLVGADDLIPGDTLPGTALNDLIFGENGHDTLKGEAGDDVLLSGDGTDQLTGGTGNDYLDGGQGYDTYVYRINDGQDTISDADGKGSIFYDGKLVVGGQRPAGSTGAYTSLDGTFTFLQSGTDLIINNLLTMKNYTPGQNGISLRDLSALPTSTPPVIDYTNSLPNDTVTLDDQDSPGVGPLGGAGGSSGNVRVFANGGNDFVFLNTGNVGNAQLFGDIGHDYLEGALGHDRLYGEDGRDILLGGLSGDDVLEGGAGEDLLKGGPGHDVLRGGADNDAVQGDSGNDVADLEIQLTGVTSIAVGDFILKPALFMNTSAAIADPLLRQACGQRARPSDPRRTARARLPSSRLRAPVSHSVLAVSSRTVMNNVG